MHLARYSAVTVVLLFVLSLGKLMAGTPSGSFNVLSYGTAIDPRPYEVAIAQADLEAYRYRDTRCILIFDNGLQIELISATEMIQQGLSVDPNNYKLQDDPNWMAPTFHLNADGTLSAMYAPAMLKQNTQAR